VDDLIQRRRISLDLALALLSRVREGAVSRDLSLAIAVVDDGGHVVASQKMDGAALGAMQLAIGKAYTSVLWGAPTGDFMQSTQPGGDDWGWNSTDPRIVVYAGGSGGTAAEDAECVLAAVQSLEFD
jgi:uncharacterized protein GlcG (DUF336 family)